MAQAKTHYKKHGIHLIEGNSLSELSKLPDGAFDCLITDPPYSSGGAFRGDRAVDNVVGKYIRTEYEKNYNPFSGDARDGRSWAFWMTLWMSEAFRVMPRGGYALVFTDWRQLSAMTDIFQAAGFTHRGIVTWDKGPAARAPHKGYFRHQAEFVVWGTKGPCFKRVDAGPHNGVLTHPTKKGKKHPTQKPLELMRELVGFMPADAVVCDPFAGAGTTLVAAKETGRDAIGFEIDLHSCETAAGWLRETKRPRPARDSRGRFAKSGA